MREKLLFVVGAALLWSTALIAQDPPPPPPDGDTPHIVIGPTADTEPPEGVVMTGDPEVDTPVVITTMFGMMDTDGNGELSQEELEAWIMHVHIPPMEPGDGGCMGDGGCGDGGCMGDGGCGDGGCMGGCGDGGCMGDGGCGDGGCMGDGGCGDGGCMGGGISAGMEGTEDLPEPDCSAATQEAEMSPVAENVSCANSEAVGNLVHRTVCNTDEFRSQAISLPAGRAADCFNVVALRGNNIEFEIVNEADGTVMFHTSMGEEAYKMLVLTGEAVYHVNLISADEPDAGLTVELIDHPMF